MSNDIINPKADKVFKDKNVVNICLNKGVQRILKMTVKEEDYTTLRDYQVIATAVELHGDKPKAGAETVTLAVAEVSDDRTEYADGTINADVRTFNIIFPRDLADDYTISPNQPGRALFSVVLREPASQTFPQDSVLLRGVLEIGFVV